MCIHKYVRVCARACVLVCKHTIAKETSGPCLKHRVCSNVIRSEVARCFPQQLEMIAKSFLAAGIRVFLSNSGCGVWDFQQGCQFPQFQTATGAIKHHQPIGLSMGSAMRYGQSSPDARQRDDFPAGYFSLGSAGQSL
jgi:hypothetical protein